MENILKGIETLGADRLILLWTGNNPLDKGNLFHKCFYYLEPYGRGNGRNSPFLVKPDSDVDLPKH